MSVSVSVTNEQLTTTSLRVMTETSDGNYRRLSLLNQYKTKGGAKLRLNGGTVIIQPVEFGSHAAAVTELTGLGYDPINLAFQTTRFPAQYTWWWGVMPVVISVREMEENTGDQEIVNLAESRTANVMGEFPRRLEQYLLAGTGSGFSALTTLNGVDVATGIFEANAPASQTHVIGGISRATYASFPGWTHQFGDIAGSYSSNGLGTGRTVTNQIKNRMHPADFILGSVSYLSNHQRSLSGHEFFAKEEQNGRAITKVFGIDADTSDYMPNAGASTTGVGNEISAYGISVKGVPLLQNKDFNMKLYMPNGGSTAWQDVPGQPIKIALVMCCMQVAPFYMGGSFMFRGGDTY